MKRRASISGYSINKIGLALSILLVVILTSCTMIAGDRNAQIQKLKWVVDANPMRDATNSIRRGDCRLLGIQGYTVAIPGIDQRVSTQYTKLYGLNIIEGTSDSFEGDDFGWKHLSLQQEVVMYAKKYNSVIKISIEKKQCEKKVPIKRGGDK